MRAIIRHSENEVDECPAVWAGQTDSRVACVADGAVKFGVFILAVEIAIDPDFNHKRFFIRSKSAETPKQHRSVFDASVLFVNLASNISTVNRDVRSWAG